MTKKPGKKKPGKTKKPAENPKPIEAAEEEKPFDFGGLPSRDLKKNLGC